MTLDAKDVAPEEQLKGFFSENVFTAIMPGEYKVVTFVAKEQS